MEYIWHYVSPFGGITLSSDGKALTGLWFDVQDRFAVPLPSQAERRSLPVFDETCRWLDIYFSGRNPGFTPKLALRGTPFRKAVWDVLLTIPFGRTMSYGEIAVAVAKQMGVSRMSAQAVGGAVGRNPVSIIVPCHRVIGSDGSLTGYAGGLDKKARLLGLERRAVGQM
ncbi:MAG: methylated-DNA--[Bacteroidales bacterium]|nr:methylated-DNA--[protein]-cysteine S-methyltransferase [Bacteroidales bacterium]MBR5072613.1 methylated-DNA--[protein]-cysteine S-methyltransferase [Bacteroidales bacterium]